MDKNSFSDFRNLYPISKTLSFGLIPQGKTLQNMNARGFIDDALNFDSVATKVKEAIDNVHVGAIDESLAGASLDWAPLAEAIAEKDRKLVTDISTSMRKQIAGLLSKHELYRVLTAATPDLVIKKCLPAELSEAMTGRASMLMHYQNNRRLLYDAGNLHGTVAYRLVDENFPLFLRIGEAYGTFKASYPERAAAMEKDLEGKLGGLSVTDILTVSNYNAALTREGIALVNTVTGGYTDADGMMHKGLTQICHELNQQTGDGSRKLPKVQPLRKHVLGEKVTLSFVAEALKDDSDVTTLIAKTAGALIENGTFEDANRCLEGIVSGSYALSDVCLRREGISKLSKHVFNDWRRIEALILRSRLENSKKGRLSKKEESEFEKAVYFTMKDVVDALVPEFGGSDLALMNIISYWTGKAGCAVGALKALKDAAMEAEALSGGRKPLRSNDATVDGIKKLFDDILDIVRCFKLLHVTEQFDNDFAYDYYPAVADMGALSKAYDKVRNYITKKPYSTESTLITFGNGAFGGGWSDMAAKGVALARHDGRYYLMVIAKGERSMRKVADELLGGTPSGGWERLEYRSLDAGKQITRLMFPTTSAEDGTKVLREDVTDPEIIRMFPRYLAKEHVSHPVGDALVPGDAGFAREMIAHFRDVVSKTHPSFSKFTLDIKPAEEYASWKEFTDEMSRQMYEAVWTGLDGDTLDSFVEKGEVFLFEIHRKDFSAGSHGRKDLHTLVFENLMSDPQNSAFKLLGGAQVRYRPASITGTTVHKAGSILVNKRTREGHPIPGNIYKQIFRYHNGLLPLSDMTAEAKMWLPLAVTKTARYDIVKDARYTRDTFTLTIPVKYNADAGNGRTDINAAVMEACRSGRIRHVIGINRGENNLVYATVTDMEGNIVEQRGFNVLNGTDYRELLRARGEDREEQRRSWKTIDNIKDIKAGYLSGVIREVCDMILRYEAVVALEDLTFNFKQGRMAIEANVYQAFESALVKKLQYLTDKSDVTTGLQLTDSAVTLDQLKGQKGILFFVSPWAVSMTDPATGFINLFHMRDFDTAAKQRDFFSRFRSIEYHSDGVRFTFRWEDFDGLLSEKDARGTWTLTSAGKRIALHKDDKSGVFSYVDTYPTEIIRDALARAGEKVDEGDDIRDILSGTSKTRLLSDVKGAFELMLKVRNVRESSEEDYYLSPALDGDGRQYDSRNAGTLPGCTDAVAAYNIARKALIVIGRPSADGNGKAVRDRDTVNKEDWLEYLAR